MSEHAIWHVRKEDLHRDSARVVDPPFASFDVVLYRDFAALEAENARLRADAKIVAGFVAGWWPGLEDGISWPASDDDEVVAAARRLLAALAAATPAAEKA